MSHVSDLMTQHLLQQALDLLHTANVHKPTSPHHEVMLEALRLRAVKERIQEKTLARYKQGVGNSWQLLEQDKLAAAATKISEIHALILGVLTAEDTSELRGLETQLVVMSDSLIPKIQHTLDLCTQQLEKGQLAAASLSRDEAQTLTLCAPLGHEAHTTFAPILQGIAIKISKLSQDLVVVDRKLNQAFGLLTQSNTSARALIKEALCLLRSSSTKHVYSRSRPVAKFRRE